MVSTHRIILLIVSCLSTLPLSQCGNKCKVRFITAHQYNKDQAKITWQNKRSCSDRYTLRYYSDSQPDIYKNGYIKDKECIVNVKPCNNYIFVFVQYKDNQQVTSTNAKLSTIMTASSMPLLPERKFLDEKNLLVSWRPPEDEDCIKFYFVELFKVPDNGCVNQTCLENIFREQVDGKTDIIIPFVGLVCTDYQIFITSSNGRTTSNPAILNFTLSTNNTNENGIDTKIKFNLLQKKVYFLAQFNWTVPSVLPKCFPSFVIELCTSTSCVDFPAYLESGTKTITDLIPSTFYTVNFKEIVNKKRKQIGTLRMTTEDIPSVENFYIIGQVHSQSVRLGWIIPKEITDQKHLFYLVLQENNGLYEEKQISPNITEMSLTNLQECRTYNFKVTVNYNGYSSQSKSIILNMPEPETYPLLSNLHVTNLSSTNVELSWDWQFKLCYPSFAVQYDNKGHHILIVKSNHASITNLSPCTRYIFDIFYINNNNFQKEANHLEVETTFKENNPVVNLSAWEKRRDGFIIKWERPVSLQCLDSYLISVHDVNQPTDVPVITFESKIDEKSIEVTGLYPCTRYCVRVVSKWRAIEGTLSEIYEDTLTQVPGEITSFKAVSSEYYLILKWEPPSIGRTCVKSYAISVKEIYPEEGKEFLKEIPGTQNNITLTNLTACTKYRISIRSVSPYSTYGPFITKDFETLFVALHVKGGQILNKTTDSVQIQWIVETDKFNKCSLTQFSSYCIEDNTKKINYGKNISLENFVYSYERLNPNKSYSCHGVVHSKEGTSLTSKAVIFETFSLSHIFLNINENDPRTNSSCGQLICMTRDKIPVVKRHRRSLFTFLKEVWDSIFSGKDTSHDNSAPKQPTNVTVVNITSQTVSIIWSPPQSPIPIITKYLINIGNVRLNYDIPKSCNQSSIANSTFSIQGNKTEYELIGLKPDTNLDINIQAVAGNETGPSSSTITVTTLPDVPDEVRNLRAQIEQNETVITWYTPCETNGELSHFFISMSGIRTNHPSIPERNWTVFKKENVERYEVVLDGLLPEYEYDFIITAMVVNVTEGNPRIERFQWPAGIPSEPNITSLAVQFSIVSSTEVIVTFNYDLFNDDQGEIQYYALLLAVNHFPQLPQNGWLGYNRSWPRENTWAEARRNNGAVSYQTTPLLWDPFKDTLESQYTLGQESCSLEDTTSYCNGPLLVKTEYSLRIRAFTTSGYRDTKSITFTTEGPVSYFQVAVVSMSFVGVISIVMLVFLIATGQFVRTKFIKKPKKKTKIVEVVGDSDAGPPHLNVKKFLQHCNTVLDSPGLMKQEFDLMISHSSKLIMPTGVALLPHNRKKNRYVNILPYDSNRVVLQGDTESDYINASYIKFQGEKPNLEFIACQAPKQEYCYDFWKMICQCKVDIIIMLCNFVEKETDKCCNYFPMCGEIVTFQNISILCKIQTENQNHILRVFVVTENGVQRIVHHFHYIEWPDFGIPSSPEAMLKLCQAVRTFTKGKELTLAVHCSAGVGRTGTYIALTMLLKHLKHNKKLNVFATILQMREQRANMVQTQGQYEYIYKCLKFAIENQKTALRGFYQSAALCISDLRSEKSIPNDQIGLSDQSGSTTLSSLSTELEENT